MTTEETTYRRAQSDYANARAALHGLAASHALKSDAVWFAPGLRKLLALDAVSAADDGWEPFRLDQLGRFHSIPIDVRAAALRVDDLTAALADAQRAFVERLRTDGLSLESVAERLGVGEQAVLDVLESG